MTGRGGEPEPKLRLRVADGIDKVGADAWNRCAGDADPLVSYAMLSALETSGSAGPSAGFRPSHLLIEDADGRLLGAMPAYLRPHSYADHGPDASWAAHYRALGRRYYPKLQVEVPYMPMPGRRLLTAPENRPPGLETGMARTLAGLAQRLGVSSAHVGFAGAEEIEVLAAAGFAISHSFHYVWRNLGYNSFDDFTASLRKKRRVELRRERRLAGELGMKIVRLEGTDLTPAQCDAFYELHRGTNARYGTTNYLTRTFFHELVTRLGDRLHLIAAMDGSRMVAAVLNIVGGETLFARYWGAAAVQRFLYFECTMYRAIEFAIETGLDAIDLGPAGPYKAERGFLPTPCASAHWITDPKIRPAIVRWLVEYNRAADAKLEAAQRRSPFRAAA